MYHGHALAWVLGETAEAARLGAAAVRVEYEPLPSIITMPEAIDADSFQGIPRTIAPRRPRARARDGAARLRGRQRGRRTGALLPRDARVPRAPRLRGAGVRRVEHAAPLGDAGDRGARARRAEQPGHGAVPAHGRRLRRQGDAAARPRRDRRARRDAHGPPGAAAAQPHAGPHDDRQAASVPRRRGRPGSTTTAASWRSRPRSPPTAAGASTSRSRSWAARSATSTTPTGSRTSSRRGASRRRTRRRRPRSAASAARRACS